MLQQLQFQLQQQQLRRQHQQPTVVISSSEIEIAERYLRRRPVDGENVGNNNPALLKDIPEEASVAPVSRSTRRLSSNQRTVVLHHPVKPLSPKPLVLISASDEAAAKGILSHRKSPERRRRKRTSSVGRLRASLRKVPQKSLPTVSSDAACDAELAAGVSHTRGEAGTEACAVQGCCLNTASECTLKALLPENSLQRSVRSCVETGHKGLPPGALTSVEPGSKNVAAGKLPDSLSRTNLSTEVQSLKTTSSHQNAPCGQPEINTADAKLDDRNLVCTPSNLVSRIKNVTDDINALEQCHLALPGGEFPELEKSIADAFCELADLLKSHPSVMRGCRAMAYALNPCKEHFSKLDVSISSEHLTQTRAPLSKSDAFNLLSKYSSETEVLPEVAINETCKSQEVDSIDDNAAERLLSRTQSDELGCIESRARVALKSSTKLRRVSIPKTDAKDNISDALGSNVSDVPKTVDSNPLIVSVGKVLSDLRCKILKWDAQWCRMSSQSYELEGSQKRQLPTTHKDVKRHRHSIENSATNLSSVQVPSAKDLACNKSSPSSNSGCDSRLSVVRSVTNDELAKSNCLTSVLTDTTVRCLRNRAKTSSITDSNVNSEVNRHRSGSEKLPSMNLATKPLPSTGLAKDSLQKDQATSGAAHTGISDSTLLHRKCSIRNVSKDINYPEPVSLESSNVKVGAEQLPSVSCVTNLQHKSTQHRISEQTNVKDKSQVSLDNPELKASPITDTRNNLKNEPVSDPKNKPMTCRRNCKDGSEPRLTHSEKSTIPACVTVYQKDSKQQDNDYKKDQSSFLPSEASKQATEKHAACRDVSKNDVKKQPIAIDNENQSNAVPKKTCTIAVTTPMSLAACKSDAKNSDNNHCNPSPAKTSKTTVSKLAPSATDKISCHNIVKSQPVTSQTGNKDKTKLIPSSSESPKKTVENQATSVTSKLCNNNGTNSELAIPHMETKTKMQPNALTAEICKIPVVKETSSSVSKTGSQSDVKSKPGTTLTNNKDKTQPNTYPLETSKSSVAKRALSVASKEDSQNDIKNQPATSQTGSKDKDQPKPPPAETTKSPVAKQTPSAASKKDSQNDIKNQPTTSQKGSKDKDQPKPPPAETSKSPVAKQTPSAASKKDSQNDIKNQPATSQKGSKDKDQPKPPPAETSKSPVAKQAPSAASKKDSQNDIKNQPATSQKGSKDKDQPKPPPAETSKSPVAKQAPSAASKKDSQNDIKNQPATSQKGSKDKDQPKPPPAETSKSPVAKQAPSAASKKDSQNDIKHQPATSQKGSKDKDQPKPPPAETSKSPVAKQTPSAASKKDSQNDIKNQPATSQKGSKDKDQPKPPPAETSKSPVAKQAPSAASKKDSQNDIKNQPATSQKGSKDKDQPKPPPAETSKSPVAKQAPSAASKKDSQNDIKTQPATSQTSSKDKNQPKPFPAETSKLAVAKQTPSATSKKDSKNDIKNQPATSDTGNKDKIQIRPPAETSKSPVAKQAPPAANKKDSQNDIKNQLATSHAGSQNKNHPKPPPAEISKPSVAKQTPTAANKKVSQNDFKNQPATSQTGSKVKDQPKPPPAETSKSPIAKQAPSATSKKGSQNDTKNQPATSQTSSKDKDQPKPPPAETSKSPVAKQALSAASKKDSQNNIKNQPATSQTGSKDTDQPKPPPAETSKSPVAKQAPSAASKKDSQNDIKNQPATSQTGSKDTDQPKPPPAETSKSPVAKQAPSAASKKDSQNVIKNQPATSQTGSKDTDQPKPPPAETSKSPVAKQAPFAASKKDSQTDIKNQVNTSVTSCKNKNQSKLSTEISKASAAKQAPIAASKIGSQNDISNQPVTSQTSNKNKNQCNPYAKTYETPVEKQEPSAASKIGTQDDVTNQPATSQSSNKNQPIPSPAEIAKAPVEKLTLSSASKAGSLNGGKSQPATSQNDNKDRNQTESSLAKIPKTSIVKLAPSTANTKGAENNSKSQSLASQLNSKDKNHPKPSPAETSTTTVDKQVSSAASKLGAKIDDKSQPATFQTSSKDKIKSIPSPAETSKICAANQSASAASRTISQNNVKNQPATNQIRKIDKNQPTPSCPETSKTHVVKQTPSAASKTGFQNDVTSQRNGRDKNQPNPSAEASKMSVANQASSSSQNANKNFPALSKPGNTNKNQPNASPSETSKTLVANKSASATNKTDSQSDVKNQPNKSLVSNKYSNQPTPSPAEASKPPVVNRSESCASNTGSQNNVKSKPAKSLTDNKDKAQSNPSAVTSNLPVAKQAPSAASKKGSQEDVKSQIATSQTNKDNTCTSPSAESSKSPVEKQGPQAASKTNNQTDIKSQASTFLVGTKAKNQPMPLRAETSKTSGANQAPSTAGKLGSQNVNKNLRQTQANNKDKPQSNTSSETSNALVTNQSTSSANKIDFQNDNKSQTSTSLIGNQNQNQPIPSPAETSKTPAPNHSASAARKTGSQIGNETHIGNKGKNRSIASLAETSKTPVVNQSASKIGSQNDVIGQPATSTMENKAKNQVNHSHAETSKTPVVNQSADSASKTDSQNDVTNQPATSTMDNEAKNQANHSPTETSKTPVVNQSASSASNTGPQNDITSQPVASTMDNKAKNQANHSPAETSKTPVVNRSTSASNTGSQNGVTSQPATSTMDNESKNQANHSSAETSKTPVVNQSASSASNTGPQNDVTSQPVASTMDNKAKNQANHSPAETSKAPVVNQSASSANKTGSQNDVTSQPATSTMDNEAKNEANHSPVKTSKTPVVNQSADSASKTGSQNDVTNQPTTSTMANEVKNQANHSPAETSKTLVVNQSASSANNTGSQNDVTSQPVTSTMDKKAKNQANHSPAEISKTPVVNQSASSASKTGSQNNVTNQPTTSTMDNKANNEANHSSAETSKTHVANQAPSAAGKTGSQNTNKTHPATPQTGNKRKNQLISSPAETSKASLANQLASSANKTGSQNDVLDTTTTGNKSKNQANHLSADTSKTYVAKQTLCPVSKTDACNDKSQSAVTQVKSKDMEKPCLSSAETTKMPSEKQLLPPATEKKSSNKDKASLSSAEAIELCAAKGALSSASKTDSDSQIVKNDPAQAVHKDQAHLLAETPKMLIANRTPPVVCKASSKPTATKSDDQGSTSSQSAQANSKDATLPSLACAEASKTVEKGITSSTSCTYFENDKCQLYEAGGRTASNIQASLVPAETQKNSANCNSPTDTLTSQPTAQTTADNMNKSFAVADTSKIKPCAKPMMCTNSKPDSINDQESHSDIVQTKSNDKNPLSLSSTEIIELESVSKQATSPGSDSDAKEDIKIRSAASQISVNDKTQSSLQSAEISKLKPVAKSVPKRSHDTNSNAGDSSDNVIQSNTDKANLIPSAKKLHHTDATVSSADSSKHQHEEQSDNVKNTHISSETSLISLSINLDDEIQITRGDITNEENKTQPMPTKSMTDSCNDAKIKFGVAEYDSFGGVAPSLGSPNEAVCANPVQLVKPNLVRVSRNKNREVKKASRRSASSQMDAGTSLSPSPTSSFNLDDSLPSDSDAKQETRHQSSIVQTTSSASKPMIGKNSHNLCDKEQLVMPADTYKLTFKTRNRRPVVVLSRLSVKDIKVVCTATQETQKPIVPQTEESSSQINKRIRIDANDKSLALVEPVEVSCDTSSRCPDSVRPKLSRIAEGDRKKKVFNRKKKVFNETTNWKLRLREREAGLKRKRDQLCLQSAEKQGGPSVASESLEIKKHSPMIVKESLAVEKVLCSNETMLDSLTPVVEKTGGLELKTTFDTKSLQLKAKHRRKHNITEVSVNVPRSCHVTKIPAKGDLLPTITTVEPTDKANNEICKLDTELVSRAKIDSSTNLKRALRKRKHKLIADNSQACTPTLVQNSHDSIASCPAAGLGVHPLRIRKSVRKSISNVCGNESTEINNKKANDDEILINSAFTESVPLKMRRKRTHNDSHQQSLTKKYKKFVERSVTSEKPWRADKEQIGADVSLKPKASQASHMLCGSGQPVTDSNTPNESHHKLHISLTHGKLQSDSIICESRLRERKPQVSDKKLEPKTTKLKESFRKKPHLMGAPKLRFSCKADKMQLKCTRTTDTNLVLPKDVRKDCVIQNMNPVVVIPYLEMERARAALTSVKLSRQTGSRESLYISSNGCPRLISNLRGKKVHKSRSDILTALRKRKRSARSVMGTPVIQKLLRGLRSLGLPNCKNATCTNNENASLGENGGLLTVKDASIESATAEALDTFKTPENSDDQTSLGSKTSIVPSPLINECLPSATDETITISQCQGSSHSVPQSNDQPSEMLTFDSQSSKNIFSDNFPKLMSTIISTANEDQMPILALSNSPLVMSTTSEEKMPKLALSNSPINDDTTHLATDLNSCHHETASEDLLLKSPSLLSLDSCASNKQEVVTCLVDSVTETLTPDKLSEVCSFETCNNDETAKDEAVSSISSNLSEDSGPLDLSILGCPILVSPNGEFNDIESNESENESAGVGAACYCDVKNDETGKEAGITSALICNEQQISLHSVETATDSCEDCLNISYSAAGENSATDESCKGQLATKTDAAVIEQVASSSPAVSAVTASSKSPMTPYDCGKTEPNHHSLLDASVEADDKDTIEDSDTDKLHESGLIAAVPLTYSDSSRNAREEENAALDVDRFFADALLQTEVDSSEEMDAEILDLPINSEDLATIGDSEVVSKSNCGLAVDKLIAATLQVGGTSSHEHSILTEDELVNPRGLYHRDDPIPKEVTNNNIDLNKYLSTTLPEKAINVVPTGSYEKTFTENSAMSYVSSSVMGSDSTSDDIDVDKLLATTLAENNPAECNRSGASKENSTDFAVTTRSPFVNSSQNYVDDTMITDEETGDDIDVDKLLATTSPESDTSAHQSDPPYVNNGSPYVSNGSPYVNTSSPYASSGSSYVNSVSSYASSGSPYVNTGSPYVNSGSPYVNTGSPYINNGSPYVNNSSPYVNNKSPYVSSQTVSNEQPNDDIDVEKLLAVSLPSDDNSMSDHSGTPVVGMTDFSMNVDSSNTMTNDETSDVDADNLLATTSPFNDPPLYRPAGSPETGLSDLPDESFVDGSMVGDDESSVFTRALSGSPGIDASDIPVIQSSLDSFETVQTPAPSQTPNVLRLENGDMVFVMDSMNYSENQVYMNTTSSATTTLSSTNSCASTTSGTDTLITVPSCIPSRPTAVVDPMPQNESLIYTSQSANTQHDVNRVQYKMINQDTHQAVYSKTVYNPCSTSSPMPTNSFMPLASNYVVPVYTPNATVPVNVPFQAWPACMPNLPPNLVPSMLSRQGSVQFQNVMAANTMTCETQWNVANSNQAAVNLAQNSGSVPYVTQNASQPMLIGVPFSNDPQQFHVFAAQPQIGNVVATRNSNNGTPMSVAPPSHPSQFPQFQPLLSTNAVACGPQNNVLTSSYANVSASNPFVMPHLSESGTQHPALFGMPFNSDPQQVHIFSTQPQVPGLVNAHNNGGLPCNMMLTASSCGLPQVPQAVISTTTCGATSSTTQNTAVNIPLTLPTTEVAAMLNHESNSMYYQNGILFPDDIPQNEITITDGSDPNTCTSAEQTFMGPPYTIQCPPPKYAFHDEANASVHMPRNMLPKRPREDKSSADSSNWRSQHKCPVCGKGYAYPANVQRHMSIAHKQYEPRRSARTKRS